ncbi:MAG: DUF3048 domain-containing protein [Chloroflexi bacterium]|nr:MAG: DUF3048 domain-containing protein [Chloroflexota bacterium]
MVADSNQPTGSPMRRGLIGLIGLAIAALGILVAARIGTLLPGGAVAATAVPSRAVAPSPTVIAILPTPTAASPTEPPPTPIATPVLVPAALTGLLVSPNAAERHPIAVMIDDLSAARPQSGFNSASIVWHAPAEGGIPRYMLIFQDEVPDGVGPVRSSREYYIEWASEWRAMYVHAGGSPQALQTLAARGRGQWVYNADEFRWGGGRYLWRTTDRFPPHNVYTDGQHLRALAKRLGAADGPLERSWTFAPDATGDLRPRGGTIRVDYPTESITYRYDATTNTYIRYINGSKTPQVDRSDGKVVAPKNVVILRMAFGPLNDGHPQKHRLEAQDVGKGVAWIATNGHTVKGQWRKASPTAPTLLYGPDGAPFTLTAGQTFVQVIQLSYTFAIHDGEPPYWIPPTHRDE